MDLTAKHYDELKAATELPDDPKPTSKDAMNARIRAIAQGRLKAPARDEIDRRVREIVADAAPPVAPVAPEPAKDAAPPVAR